MSVKYRIITFVVVLASCFPPVAWAQTANLAPGFKSLLPGAKVALMPLDVELFSISAGGVLEPQADWTGKALAHMRTALRERKDMAKVEFVDVEENADDAIEELNRLHGAVGNAVAFHHFGPFSLPTKEKKLDWSLGSDVQAIKQRTGANYALFTFVRDSYASSERVAAMVVAAIFGVGLGGGMQVGYASLVDLDTGNIVWFNRLLRGSGDLREIEPARESVKALLVNFPG
jgi:hypothetical protein